MLLHNVLAALFAIQSRQIARRFRDATIPLNIVVYGIIAISGLVYGMIEGLSDVSLGAFTNFAGFFVFAGVCFAAANMLSYVVFQYVDAAVASLLATFNVITTVILATVLINEGLTILQLVGAAVILASMQLVLSIHMSEARHNKLVLAVVLSILASVFCAVAVTTEKYLLDRVNLSTYLVFGWGFQFIGVVLVSLLLIRVTAAKDYLLLGNAKFWRMALPAGMTRMLGGLLFILSLRLADNLSLVSAFSGLKVVLAALLGMYVLKEREFMARKLKAAMMAMIGVAIMLWT